MKKLNEAGGETDPCQANKYQLKYRVARHVVDYLLLTTKYEIPMFPLGSRAATVAAHQPAEHKNNFEPKLGLRGAKPTCTEVPLACSD